MTMRKVWLFALVLVLALLGFGYAHISVTAAQDDLLLYPIAELGDPGAISGRTASMTFACGDHLSWRTTHTFGDDTETTFDYNSKGIPLPPYVPSNLFQLHFTGSFSTHTNGSIGFQAGKYGDLINAVAANTPTGGVRTESLRLQDYVSHYMPDFELYYEDDNISCSESATLFAHLTGESLYEQEGCYHALLRRFRFPVQEHHTISVTVEKHADVGISGITLDSEHCPELLVTSDVTAEGIWFLPIFRDEDGLPLQYEAPLGYGIYFAPWKETGRIVNYAATEKTEVTPDLDQLRLVCPLEETLIIDALRLESGEAWLLTRNEEACRLTVCDLSSGETKLSLDILLHDPGTASTAGSILRYGNYLLIHAQSSLALVDTATKQLLLTAPDAEHRFTAKDFSPETGTLHWDGKQLTLIDSSPYDHTCAFWIAAYTQDQLRYYGEYSSSLLRDNDRFYYSYITLSQEPITLQ